jgi:hypothetical protein
MDHGTESTAVCCTFPFEFSKPPRKVHSALVLAFDSERTEDMVTDTVNVSSVVAPSGTGTLRVKTLPVEFIDDDSLKTAPLSFLRISHE